MVRLRELAAANIMGGADHHDPHNHSAHGHRRGHHRGKGVREAWAFPGPSGGHDAGADPTMAPRPSRGVGLQGLVRSPPVRPRKEARQRANEAWALCRGRRDRA
jgi:hypothetical protein